MNEFQFEKSPKRKGRCPSCGHANEWRFLMDKNTGDRLDEKYGKCERKNNCGHKHFPNSFKCEYTFTPSQPSVTPPKYISYDIVANTIETNHSENNFTNWLVGLVGKETTIKAVERFFIGTYDHCTAFWYADYPDSEIRFRSLKKISYGKEGRRGDFISYPFTQEQGYRPCLFGQHQLKKYPNKTVALVESEKTAILGFVSAPDFLWLATGGNNGLTEEKGLALRNRNVIIFPDADKAGREGATRSKNILTGIASAIEIRDIFTNRTDGHDYADYVVESLTGRV